MPSDIFHASRWTSGNHLFRTVIEVTDKSVMRRKRSWFNVDEMSITISKVASIHIRANSPRVQAGPGFQSPIVTPVFIVSSVRRKFSKKQAGPPPTALTCRAGDTILSQ